VAKEIFLRRRRRRKKLVDTVDYLKKTNELLFQIKQAALTNRPSRGIVQTPYSPEYSNNQIIYIETKCRRKGDKKKFIHMI